MKIDIRWTNSLCRKAGLSLAALLLFVIALSTAVSKSRASDKNDSSSAAESSSQAPVIKYDTTYEQMSNSAFEENSGLLALDSKDRRPDRPVDNEGSQESQRNADAPDRTDLGEHGEPGVPAAAQAPHYLRAVIYIDEQNGGVDDQDPPRFRSPLRAEIKQT